MKLLVFSDSHGIVFAMREAVRAEAPDAVLHLGDHVRDCSAVREAFPDIPLRAVRGNCDPGSRELETDEFTISGKRIFMTHGHPYGVKRGLASIINTASVRGADILLYGHTHVPYYTEENGLVILNPGSVGEARDSKNTYAVLNIENGVITCAIKDAERF